MRSSKLVSAVLLISLVLLIIGELFKIQHYPNGSIISVVGLGTYIILSMLELNRLNKVIENSNAENV